MPKMTEPGKTVISVIIPSYNRSDLLEECLKSVIGQNYTGWEAIVVDDGSETDNEAVVSEFILQDPRIRFVKRNRMPRGAPVCRNIGVEEARGQYILFLDSDDLLAPHALTQRTDVILLEPDLDFWVFPMLIFRESPEDAGFLWNIDNGEADLNRFLRLDAPWQTSGPLWKKEAVIAAGGFTEGLACWQDVDFHLKALTSGLSWKKYYHLIPDVFYRRHETQSISQGEINSPEKLRSRREIFMRSACKLLPVITPQLKDDLGLLGGNIAIGAARALSIPVCLSVISFGVRNRIFRVPQVITFLVILLLYLLRVNRISAFDHWLQRIIKRYKRDSGIGKYQYKTL
jgi:glycosyltransferase involved in cell wall biosynthesis